MAAADLVLETTHLRLIQTASLLEWLVRRDTGGEDLRDAWRSVEAACVVVENLRAR